MKLQKLETLFHSVIMPIAVMAVLVGCTSSKDTNPAAPASESKAAAEQEASSQNGAKNVVVINLLLE